MDHSVTLFEEAPLKFSEGVVRSARLLQSLGPDASAIWAELRPHEVKTLSNAMNMLETDHRAESDASRDFMTVAAQSSGEVAGDMDIWRHLSALDSNMLADLLEGEHPQTLALVLSNLSGEAAARLLRAMAPETSVDAMQRLLHLKDVNPTAFSAIERYLKSKSAGSRQGAQGGHERVARIFDRLDNKLEQAFLAALDSAEPGAGEKVRSLMFTFDDLAALDAGGMQTLLSRTDRAVLVLALKGASDGTCEAFFRNMTSRAGELLKEEMSLLGAVRRSEIDAARQELVELARSLIQRGDIRSGQDDHDDELVD